MNTHTRRRDNALVCTGRLIVPLNPPPTLSLTSSTEFLAAAQRTRCGHSVVLRISPGKWRHLHRSTSIPHSTSGDRSFGAGFLLVVSADSPFVWILCWSLVARLLHSSLHHLCKLPEHLVVLPLTPPTLRFKSGLPNPMSWCSTDFL